MTTTKHARPVGLDLDLMVTVTWEDDRTGGNTDTMPANTAPKEGEEGAAKVSKPFPALYYRYQCGRFEEAELLCDFAEGSSYAEALSTASDIASFFGVPLTDYCALPEPMRVSA